MQQAYYCEGRQIAHMHAISMLPTPLPGEKIVIHGGEYEVSKREWALDSSGVHVKLYLVRLPRG